MNRIIAKFVDVGEEFRDYVVKDDDGKEKDVRASLEYELTNPNNLRHDLQNHLTGKLVGDFSLLFDRVPETGLIALIHGAVTYDESGAEIEDEYGINNEYFGDLVEYMQESVVQGIIIEPGWEGDVKILEEYYGFKETGLLVDVEYGEEVPLMLWKQRGE